MLYDIWAYLLFPFLGMAIEAEIKVGLGKDQCLTAK